MARLDPRRSTLLMLIPLCWSWLQPALARGQTCPKPPDTATYLEYAEAGYDRPVNSAYVRTGQDDQHYVYYGPSKDNGEIDLCKPAKNPHDGGAPTMGEAAGVSVRTVFASFAGQSEQGATPRTNWAGEASMPVIFKLENVPPKNWWDTSGAAALITTLIAGIFGTIIAQLLQGRARVREQGRVRLEAFLAEERSVVASAYETIARALAAVEDLTALVSEPWRTGMHPTIVGIRGKFWNSFMSGKRQWILKRHVTGLLVTLAHPNSPGLLTQWKDLDQSLGAYIDSAVHVYDECVDKRGITQQEQNELNDKRELIVAGLDRFTKSVVSARSAHEASGFAFGI